MWPGEATLTTYTNVSTLTDAETKVADFAPRAKLKSQLPCHYVLILDGAVPSGLAH